MTTVAYIAIYAGLIIFCAGCLWRIRQYARTPQHLRWELYPVPHEGPYRAAYGGSYFEAQEWWRGPQIANRRHEWRVMAEEILLLKSLREFNRRLWLPSFFFHFGLYLAIAAAALATLAGVTAGMVVGKANAGIAGLMGALIAVVGLAAAVLVISGACWLMVRRIADPAVRNSTRPADLFNLMLFTATCSLLAGGSLIRGPGSASLVDFVRGAFHFDRGVRIGAVFGAGVILASALAAYIPFTHMAHFIAKYFAWHSVRWDDRRNERGSRIEAKIAANLGFKPTWSAEHVGADGKRTWAEVASTNPAQETRK
ncbi:dsrM-like [Candidatus Sulfotelmatomonas gaucii]|uniref:DsrM-like n=1 Tax=Candidatus Sulfuritelmatomonas gaucii TaxID=2043161 RepID=A0A2N9M691_9BACT|nr:dsrM-like [Candidatus Sulfotelmatomonas gaucii]